MHRNDKFKIYDEWLLEKNQETSLQLENVMDIYRNLRENNDFYLRYEVAGEFFVREMELKRKYKENKNPVETKKTVQKNPLEQIASALGVYSIISQYGHSLYRPFYASIPILGFFIVLFCYDDASKPEFIKYSSQDLLIHSLFRSVSGFFPFYSSEQTDYWDIILRIILLPISGSFFIALKRKLERKFRH